MMGQTMNELRDEDVARDLPEFLRVLEEIRDKVPVVTQHVEQLSEAVISPDVSTENGISLLEVKVHLLLSSLINLTQLMLMKTEGQSINTSPPVLRLVEIRTVLEKLRPLDQKLRYQIDKLIRTAQTGISAASNDPLRHRANPANMVSKLGEEVKDQSDEEVAEEEEGEGKGDSSQLYVPPKVVATPYDEEEDGRSKARLKKRVKSAIVQELRNEYLDLPEEVNAVGSGLRSVREMEEEREREMYEEANFVRLPTGVKRKSRLPGRGGGEVLDDLMDLGEFPSSSVRSRKRKQLTSKKGTRSKGRHRH